MTLKQGFIGVVPRIPIFIANVADFGLALRIDDAATHVSAFQGTLSHMAPEAQLGRVSKAGDVYSFGICLWELFTRGHAYADVPRALLGHRVAVEGLRPRFPPFAPWPYAELAEACWAADPDARPPFERVVAELQRIRGALGGATRPLVRHRLERGPPPGGGAAGGGGGQSASFYASSGSWGYPQPQAAAAAAADDAWPAPQPAAGSVGSGPGSGWDLTAFEGGGLFYTRSLDGGAPHAGADDDCGGAAPQESGGGVGARLARMRLDPIPDAMDEEAPHADPFADTASAGDERGADDARRAPRSAPLSCTVARGAQAGGRAGGGGPGGGGPGGGCVAAAASGGSGACLNGAPDNGAAGDGGASGGGGAGADLQQWIPDAAPTSRAVREPALLRAASVQTSGSCVPGAARPRRALVVRGAAAPERREIPIFPLGVVPLPHATVPLMIFEPRGGQEQGRRATGRVPPSRLPPLVATNTKTYRVLFNTLMAGTPGIEDGLVQAESPYAGTKRFGMCYVDGGSGKMATVGTLLDIQAHSFEPDGRILVVNKGAARFRVTKVVKERPVLICEVEVLPEDEDDSLEAKELAEQVAALFRNVLRLFRKVKLAQASKAAGAAGPAAGAAAAAAAAAAGGGGGVEASEDDIEELAELDAAVGNPTRLSYWIASVLGEHRLTQQVLLEEDTTMGRLLKEAEVLGQTVKFYSAATALESVFSSGGDGGAAPPAGGPD
ncbi:MAG: hypothetical protein J3K34DRAFT_524170 [Monoraphidium minutum]|nr:MAG: hypothetical protein J3K34DRAFT_524170 [Monoraphidium minutum]